MVLCPQVLLAKLKSDNKFYAVKVLQKKIVLKKKEVPHNSEYNSRLKNQNNIQKGEYAVGRSGFNNNDSQLLYLFGTGFFRVKQKNIMAERNVLLKSMKHPFLVGLHYSFQTPEKLYFVMDYVNGGEVMYGVKT